MTGHHKKRAHPRLDTSWTAVWWTRDQAQTHHGIVRDASLDGVFIELPGKLNTERIKHVNLECLLPDGSVSRVRGSVVWHGKKQGRSGVGVHLDRADGSYRAFIERAARTPTRLQPWDDETTKEASTRALSDGSRRDYLVMMTGAHAGASYEVGDSVIIGRHTDCDVVLLDASASRRHTAIRNTALGVILEDLGSSNGTFVNGQRVKQTELHDGDRVQIGSTVLKMFSEDDLEVRLRHAQKLESLGRLASGAAHDFNNILSIVTASASLICEMTDRPELQKLAENILDASDNAAKITRQMLSVARRTEFKRQTFELQRLVKGLEAVFQQRTRGSHELELEIEPNLWLLADYAQLEQVILNLFNNAIDAMQGEPGRLRVLAETRTLEMTDAADLHLRPGPYALVELRDTGAGMDEKTLERALEPYFTTKGEGYGTGLGLPMAKGIVQAHDGALELESTPGKGTIVSLWLPLAAPRSAGELGVGMETAPLHMRGQDRLVLLVDDDVQVRRAIGEMLGFLGYRVVEANNGTEALALARDTRFDLALIDVRMPFESGVDVAQDLRRRNPELEIVMCSGCVDGELPDDLGERFLRKPFEIKTLATALARFS